MAQPLASPPFLPAEYYRRHAARVRQLASEATTPGIKEHLQDVARQCERLADHVETTAAARPREFADS